MADGTLISWSEATWSPITGCSIESPGCKNCYAMTLAGTRLKNHPSRIGLTEMTKRGPVWTGEVRFNSQWIDQPLDWTKPRMIFVCAHADLFHPSVPDKWIDEIFARMAIAEHHTFQVLTKRSERMRQYFAAVPQPRWMTIMKRVLVERKKQPPEWGVLLSTKGMALRNVWLGVSVEDRERLTRIADLRKTPAVVRWVSFEPLLEALDTINLRGIHWAVVGGERARARSRPFDASWARSIRDQCKDQDVRFHMKQMGNNEPIPDDLMIREFPA